MVSRLTSAGATVTPGSDHLASLLDLIAAIPQVFASDTSNVFMLSRTTLALIRGTRVGADNLPAFDPTTRTILGYRTVVNDYLEAGRIVFGDFRSGAYLRRSGLYFQKLDQVYLTSGKIGLRFMLRADWSFFAEAADAATAEQPIYMLLDDFGS